MSPLARAFFIVEGHAAITTGHYATHVLCPNRMLWHGGRMTRDKDPLAIAKQELDQLEEQAEQARRRLVEAIYGELERGVPKTVVGRRIGIHAETVRRWLRAYGYDDAVAEPRGGSRRSPRRRSQ